jgi:uncharacterized protein YqgV (UPF0045/DUF77 family)
MIHNNVNLAIQVLPLHLRQPEAYAIVDVAIKCIHESGLKYVVTPFETVVEGPYNEVMGLLDQIQEACHTAGANELIINMKLQRSFVKNVAIEDKTGKYS